MRGPLFRVGQHVGVCVRDLSIVIPETTVLQFKWKEAGPMRNQHGVISEQPACWRYVVSAYPRSKLDRRKRFWIPEAHLRAITPGEYLDAEQDIALPVDGVSA